MLGGISAPTKIVSAIHPDLPGHAGKGMRMRRKCFGNLPFPTEACQEVYPYPPKLFRQFMVTFCGKPAKPSKIFWSFMVTLPNALWSVCLPSENILELYHYLPQYAR